MKKPEQWDSGETIFLRQRVCFRTLIILMFYGIDLLFQLYCNMQLIPVHLFSERQAGLSLQDILMFAKGLKTLPASVRNQNTDVQTQFNGT